MAGVIVLVQVGLGRVEPGVGGKAAVEYGRRNLTGRLTASIDGGSGLPKPGTSRLRATWLADCGQLPGRATFMAAAGISCSQRLGDLVSGLEPGSEEQAVALLGTARP